MPGPTRMSAYSVSEARAGSSQGGRSGGPPADPDVSRETI